MAAHRFNQNNKPQDLGPLQEKQTSAASLPMSAMGITSLVMGIIALVISWVPIINNLTFIFSLLGLIFGLVAFLGIKHNKRRGKGVTCAGIVISIVSFAIMIATQSFYGAAVKKAAESIDTKSTSASVSAAPAQEEAKSDDSGKKQEKTQDDSKESSEGDINNGKYHIAIKNAVLSGEDHEGNPTVLVTYEVTNNQKDKTSNMFDWDIKVFQNGATLNNTPVFTHNPKGYDPKATHYQTQIQAGGSFTYTEAFIVRDKQAPIRVEIASVLGGKTKISKEFNLA